MNSGSPPGVDISSGSYGLSLSGRIGLRLALKPKTELMGAVDGAWWPRTTNSFAEFPAMIAGIQLRRGPVERVTFSSLAWGDMPGRMVVGGASIELAGSTSLDRRTVLVSGAGWDPMVLLVIPPQTDEQTLSGWWRPIERGSGHDSTDHSGWCARQGGRGA
jgi:hypothetical protein